MSRWVVPKRTGLKADDPNQEKPDGALGRITKYVPAEILSGYTALFTLLISMNLLNEQKEYAALGLMGLFFFVTIAFIWVKAGTGKIRKAHLIVSPIAFLAWAYPISSALIESFFIPIIAFSVQVLAIALSIFIRPVE
jgi:hypothetical protein